jgi:hypothetical protein
MKAWGLVPLVLSCWLDRLRSLPSSFFVVFAFLVVWLVNGLWRCDEQLLWHLFALGPSCLGQCQCRCGPFVREKTQSQALCLSYFIYSSTDRAGMRGAGQPALSIAHTAHKQVKRSTPRYKQRYRPRICGVGEALRLYTEVPICYLSSCSSANSKSCCFGSSFATPVHCLRCLSTYSAATRRAAACIVTVVLKVEPQLLQCHQLVHRSIPALGAGDGYRAAACCGGHRRRRLRCAKHAAMGADGGGCAAACCGGRAGEVAELLHAAWWAQAKDAALLSAAVGVLAKEASLLHASVGAGEGCCAATPVLRGWCWRRRLGCCMLRWGQAKEAALLHATVA